ncbi:helix-turn-helix domain-containing protein [Rubrivivax gelatinosus]|uniref:helix-turn-helix domain-containing protein n=1 Tax=Rubrivivax gelatinosus TaxID=28068 RepID=UPI003A8076D6
MAPCRGPNAPEQALARCGGRAGDAAQALGVNRSTLWRWLREPPGPCAGQGES